MKPHVMVFGLTLACLMVSGAGCTSPALMSREEMRPGEDYDICEVVTTSGEHIKLREVWGGHGTIKDSTIVGASVEGKPVKLPLSEVSAVYVPQPDGTKTLLAILGVVVGSFLLLAGLVAMSWQ
jgi:hypothetical protein